MGSNAPLVVEDAIRLLRKRYGKPLPFGKSRLLRFGNAITCSINYSKRLRSEKYFFGLATDVVDPKFKYPKTRLGEFVLLVCGSAETIIVLPRAILLEMTRNVPTRKIDIFVEDNAFVLQTTGHPKLNVTEFLNRFPDHRTGKSDGDGSDPENTVDRSDVRIQNHLIQLGRAEGCKVWVPPSDRNLSYRSTGFASMTLDRLPNLDSKKAPAE